MVVRIYRSPTGLFQIEYQPDGAVAIRGSNGRYLMARMNGSLYAVSDSPSSAQELFLMVIINRPLLVLRCEYGFVGLKSANNPRYECNKTVYDVFFVEAAGSAYYLKGIDYRSIGRRVTCNFFSFFFIIDYILSTSG